MNVIVIDRGGGEVTIRVPAERYQSDVAAYDARTKDQLRFADRPRSIQDLDTDPLPVDPGNPKRRLFRQSWTVVAGKVAVDMTKARVEKLASIRVLRDKKLADTDKLVARATDDNDQPELARLRSLRRTLRDLPATVDLTVFTDPVSLDQFVPPELA